MNKVSRVRAFCCMPLFPLWWNSRSYSLRDIQKVERKHVQQTQKNPKAAEIPTCAHRCTTPHRHTQQHNSQTWKMIQRTESFSDLSFSCVLCSSVFFFSQTLIALTGGIPDGLLHCVCAAAHSGKDKSLSAVHHRLRWKNWLHGAQRCNLQQETTEIVLFRHVCNHWYLPFYCLFVLFHFCNSNFTL